jgi:hypothetical protein
VSNQASQIRRQVRRARVTVRAALPTRSRDARRGGARAGLPPACDVFEHADSVARGRHRGPRVRATSRGAPAARARCEVARRGQEARLGAALPADPPRRGGGRAHRRGEAIDRSTRCLRARPGARVARRLGALDAAIRSHEKATSRGGGAAASGLARERAAGALRPILVALRRAVRCVRRGSRDTASCGSRRPATPTTGGGGGGGGGLRDAPSSQTSPPSCLNRDALARGPRQRRPRGWQ